MDIEYFMAIAAVLFSLIVCLRSFRTKKKINKIPASQLIPRRKIITDDTPIYNPTPNFGALGQASTTYFKAVEPVIKQSGQYEHTVSKYATNQIQSRSLSPDNAELPEIISFGIPSTDGHGYPSTHYRLPESALPSPHIGSSSLRLHHDESATSHRKSPIMTQNSLQTRQTLVNAAHYDHAPSPVLAPLNTNLQNTRYTENSSFKVPPAKYNSVASTPINHAIAIQTPIPSTTRKRLFLDEEDRISQINSSVPYRSIMTTTEDLKTPAIKKRKGKVSVLEILENENLVSQRVAIRRRKREQSTTKKGRVVRATIPAPVSLKRKSGTYKFDDSNDEEDIREGWTTKSSRLKKIKSVGIFPEPSLPDSQPIEKSPYNLSLLKDTPVAKQIPHSLSSAATPSGRFKMPATATDINKRKIVPGTPLKQVMNEEEVDEKVLEVLKSAGKKAGFTSTPVVAESSKLKIPDSSSQKIKGIEISSNPITFTVPVVDSESVPGKKLPYSSPAPKSFGKPQNFDSVESTPEKLPNEKPISFSFTHAEKKDEEKVTFSFAPPEQAKKSEIDSTEVGTNLKEADKPALTQFAPTETPFSFSLGSTSSAPSPFTAAFKSNKDSKLETDSLKKVPQIPESSSLTNVSSTPISSAASTINAQFQKLEGDNTAIIEKGKLLTENPVSESTSIFGNAPDASIPSSVGNEDKPLTSQISFGLSAPSISLKPGVSEAQKSTISFGNSAAIAIAQPFSLGGIPTTSTEDKLSSSNAQETKLFESVIPAASPFTSTNQPTSFSFGGTSSTNAPPFTLANQPMSFSLSATPTTNAQSSTPSSSAIQPTPFSFGDTSMNNAPPSTLTTSTSSFSFGNAPSNNTTPSFGLGAATSSKQATSLDAVNIQGSVAPAPSFTVGKPEFGSISTSSIPAFRSQTNTASFATKEGESNPVTKPFTAVGFGSATASSGFGSQSISVFGQQPAAPSTFGVQSSTPSFGFGQQPSTSVVFGGQTSKAPGFGSQSSVPSFGFGQQQTSSTTAFSNQAPATGLVNQNNTASFSFGGSTPQTTAPSTFQFGQTPSATPTFGQNIQAQGFGIQQQQMPLQQFGFNAQPQTSFGFGGQPAQQQGFQFGSSASMPSSDQQASGMFNMGAPSGGRKVAQPKSRLKKGNMGAGRR